MSRFSAFSNRNAGVQTPGPVNVQNMRLNDGGTSYSPQRVSDLDPRGGITPGIVHATVKRRMRLSPGFVPPGMAAMLAKSPLEAAMEKKEDPMEKINEARDEIKQFVGRPKDKFSELSGKAVGKLSKEKPKKKEIVGLLKSLDISNK